MTVYLVERNLKGIAMSDLAAAQKLAISTSNAYAAGGTPMRYIRSTFAPQDGRCMCLFEASCADDVKRLNDEAKLPYSRIVEALDLTP
jgi:Nickel responsive protein SCO4226-like